MFLFLIALLAIVLSFLAVNADSVVTREVSARETRVTGFADSTRLENELFAEASKARVPVPAEPAPAQSTVPVQPKTQIIVMRPPAPLTIPKQRIPPITESERELARRFREMKNNAVLSKSGIDAFTADGYKATDGQTGGTRAALPGASPPYAPYEQISPEALQAFMQGVRDSNGQGQKLDFLLKEGAERTPRGYSDSTRMPQISPLELKAGTVIPGLLLTGINSDLPGTVIGQVSENVYDSATGNYLLIPQGARVLGAYDSKITYGQKRVGIVWNRIVFPDGSSLNIAGSPGTDLAGFSGIKGAVDNHYGQLFTSAVFTSVFAGAADIATGGRNTGSDDRSKSVRDIIVETVGAEVAQLGAKLAERALEVQPTVKINPGQRFNVMVQQDVVFLQTWAPAKTTVSGFKTGN
jgi:type IV secretion system protein VirB10